VVEREYLRFGIVGIFFGRFIPGVRAVVPPFAGLANLGPWRALIPMATASAIWYGGVALIGAAIGAEWSRISVILGEVNQTLAIVAVVAALIVALVVIRRRRQGGRLWQALRRAIPGTEALPEAGPDAMTQAALALLEVAYADPALPAEERARITGELRSRWDLPHAEAREPADEAEWRGVRQRLLNQFGEDRRCALLERLWTVAFAEPGSTESRARLVRNAAVLLGMSTSEIANVETRVRAGGATSA
jgi:uncharacterized tellurite resistance protein B-like protein